MTQSQRFSRRTALRGLGAAVMLPWLESLPSALLGNESGQENTPPLRTAFLFVPNGIHIPDWTPPEEGPLGDLPPILASFEKRKADLSVLSGLTLNAGRALGDGPGDHARCVASFLTGAHPYKTDGKDIRNGISVDQRAAEVVGNKTRFPSLELGSEASSQGGRCDSGYSCVYTSNMSWRTPTSPMAKEINPRAVFDRLFGAQENDSDRIALLRRNQHRQSILDFVAEDADKLRGRLGSADQRKLDEYLYAIRQIERRLNQAEAVASSPDATGFERPEGVPSMFEDQVRLMMDMIVLAFQTDSTRIISYMFTNAGSNRSYPEIGVDAGHHHISHHGNDPEKLAQISKINTLHAELFSYFLDRLADVEEAGETLLDHSMILYGSGICDGNRHNHEDLPILLAGRGNGSITPGQHVRFPDETPLTNLYLTMLNRLGVEDDSFSDSTGELSL
jgi:hypothetical protein